MCYAIFALLGIASFFIRFKCKAPESWMKFKTDAETIAEDYKAIKVAEADPRHDLDMRLRKFKAQKREGERK